jgi:hypothetical protein
MFYFVTHKNLQKLHYFTILKLEMLNYLCNKGHNFFIFKFILFLLKLSF